MYEKNFTIWKKFGKIIMCRMVQSERTTHMTYRYSQLTSDEQWKLDCIIDQMIQHGGLGETITRDGLSALRLAIDDILINHDLSDYDEDGNIIVHE